MVLIGLCAAKGGPGVTTAAVAMAACWPGAEVPILVEADPGGGDLGVRFGLSSTPGLVSLAAAARHATHPACLTLHVQRLPIGPQVVIGPADVRQARSTVSVLSARGVGLMRAVAADPEVVVLLDAGRVDPGSPALGLLQVASAVLVVTRPLAEDLSHAAGVVSAVSSWTPRPGLVLVGRGHSQREVEQELQVPVLAHVPEDPDGAGGLCGRAMARGMDRTPLGRAASRLAGRILFYLREATTGEPGEASGPRSPAAPGSDSRARPGPQAMGGGTDEHPPPALTLLDEAE